MTMKHPVPIHRRTQHSGVLSDGAWVAHDRAAGDNGVPDQTVHKFPERYAKKGTK